LYRSGLFLFHFDPNPRPSASTMQQRFGDIDRLLGQRVASGLIIGALISQLSAMHEEHQRLCSRMGVLETALRSGAVRASQQKASVLRTAFRGWSVLAQDMSKRRAELVQEARCKRLRACLRAIEQNAATEARVREGAARLTAALSGPIRRRLCTTRLGCDVTSAREADPVEVGCGEDTVAVLATTDQARCTACWEWSSKSAGLACQNAGCFLCSGCAACYVSTVINEGHGTLGKEAAVRCPACSAAFSQRSIATALPPKAFDRYLQAWRASVEPAKDSTQVIASEDGPTQALANLLVQTVLGPPRCPLCAQPYGFEGGCLDMRCDTILGCGHRFCGVCHEAFRSDDPGHSARCILASGFDTVEIGVGDFEALHRRRVVRQAREVVAAFPEGCEDLILGAAQPLLLGCGISVRDLRRSPRLRPTATDAEDDASWLALEARALSPGAPADGTPEELTLWKSLGGPPESPASTAPPSRSASETGHGVASLSDLMVPLSADPEFELWAFD